MPTNYSIGTTAKYRKSRIMKFKYSDYSHWPPLTMAYWEGAGVAETFTA
jgi:hypothetical protein